MFEGEILLGHVSGRETGGVPLKKTQLDGEGR